MTASSRRAVLVGFFAIIVVVGTISPVGSTLVSAEISHTEPGDSTIGSSQSQFGLVQDDTADDNNETVRHVHPDEYDEQGDPSALETWLVDRMVDSINASTARIEDDEYDDADRYVGDGYDEYLQQYLEITSETDRDDQSELFEVVREDQADVIDVAQRYDELSDEYERALDDGDEDAARERARELEELATAANDSSTGLRERYSELETETDANLSDSDAAIETVTEDIQATQESIRDEQFVRTTLSVDADRERISFLEPLTGVGQLRTVEGDPVRNEPVRLEIDNSTVETETDLHGQFEFDYRPTEEPLSTEQRTIEYAPVTGSVFLGNETTVPVSIEQTDPTVSDLETSSSVGYGENATVSGELAVEGTPVDGVPLAVTLDDERIGTTETTNGSFDAEAPVPATVADGDRELGVRLGDDDRALANTSATNSVTVRETDGTISLSATRPEDGGQTIDVTGTFETADGEDVPGETIRLDGDGTTLETTTTDDDGTFAATVTVPDESGAELDLVATYDGSESNVESTAARTTVPLSTTETQSWLGLSVWAWIGTGTGVLVCFGIGIILWWRSRSSDSDRGPVSDLPLEGDEIPLEPPAGRSRTAIARSLLGRGRDRLADGDPEGAVEMGYAAVRYALSTHSRTSGAATHREFYRNWRASLEETPHDRSDDALLRTIIERYERTTFGATTVSAEDAEAVLEAASKLCERTVDRSDESDGATSSD